MTQETDFTTWYQEKRWYLPPKWCKAQCREFYIKNILTKERNDPLDTTNANSREPNSNPV